MLTEGRWRLVGRRQSLLASLSPTVSGVHRQTAVPAYFSSKQLLLFVFARQVVSGRCLTFCFINYAASSSAVPRGSRGLIHPESSNPGDISTVSRGGRYTGDRERLRERWDNHDHRHDNTSHWERLEERERERERERDGTTMTTATITLLTERDLERDGTTMTTAMITLLTERDLEREVGQPWPPPR